MRTAEPLHLRLLRLLRDQGAVSRAELADRLQIPRPRLLAELETLRFAHEVHPSEIAYDYWTTKRTLEAFGHRPAFGLNWNPSHLVWQELDPVNFIFDFADRITSTARTRRCVPATAGAAGWPPPALGRTCVGTGASCPPVTATSLGRLLPGVERDRVRRSDLH